MEWADKRVLVTGGASFIGSHLVDALVARRATVCVVDSLSSGMLDNIKGHVEARRVTFRRVDLLDSGAAEQVLRDLDFVFHLAADHGGRGYLATHQVGCASNFILDGTVFRACARGNVGKVVYASSGCVYPNYLQNDPRAIVQLSEDKVGPPYDADGLYGWTKLMGEMVLKAYHQEVGLKSACCRYFTVYGERGHENHAVIAMIARAFIRQDPYVVWGDGSQTRNWTHVSDIVEGTLLAAEKIDDATAVNLGTAERTRVSDVVEEVFRYTGHTARIELHPEMPTGPLHLVADCSLARRLLGWEPRTRFIDGLHRTIDWYFSCKDREQVRALLERRLTGH